MFYSVGTLLCQESERNCALGFDSKISSAAQHSHSSVLTCTNPDLKQKAKNSQSSWSKSRGLPKRTVSNP